MPISPLPLTFRRGDASNSVGFVIVPPLFMVTAVSPLFRNRCGWQSKTISNSPAFSCAGVTSSPLLYTAIRYSFGL